MTDIKEIVFPQDTKARKQFFKAASFSHPAKMSLGLQIYLIEHYTRPGDTILDPMLGSGTVLVACALGRHVIGIELEQKYVDMAKANWDKVKALGPMLGYIMGEAVILQGDARDLEGLLADSCIFSPPYSDQINAKHRSSYCREPSKISKEKNLPRAYSTNPNNIGNLPHGSISAIVSSPPYAEAQIGDSRKTHNLTIQGIGKNGKPRGGSLKAKFQADVVISSPPYEGIDVSQTHQTSDKRGDSSNPNYRPSWKKKIAEGYCKTKRPYADVICTSPPYEEAMGKKHHSPKSDKLSKEKSLPQSYTGRADIICTSPPYEGALTSSSQHGNTGIAADNPKLADTGRYKTENLENIGNLKSDNYLSAMAQVYRQCYKVLKDRGLLVLVTKNFIRNKKIIRLDLDTIKLCENAGFALKERLKRKLTQQSFWRTIYYQKYPDAPKIEFEDVLVFER